MSESDDELAARGRAIFERLRTKTVTEPPEPVPTEMEDDVAVIDEPLVVVDPASDPRDPVAVAEPAPEASADTLIGETVDHGTRPTVGWATEELQALAVPPLVEPLEPAIAEGAADAWPSGAPSVLEAPPIETTSVVDETGEGDQLDDAADPLHDAAVEQTRADAFARPLPRILAVANQKGGVGKTTTAVNLGAALAELGYRVLVVDLDPQGNATTGLGINARNLDSSVYDVITNDLPLEDCIEPTTLRNLFVAPATIDLAGAEIELVPAFSRELRLRRALEEAAGEYDFTLIDCPPSLGLLTVNGLAAAGEVLVPIQCEYYALEGLGQLLRNIGLVQRNLNAPLELTAIVLTMYDARTKLADQVAREVRTHFGPKVCRTVVPRTVRLSEAPSFGQPVIVFDPSSRGAVAYRELAKEVSGGTPRRAG